MNKTESLQWRDIRHWGHMEMDGKDQWGHEQALQLSVTNLSNIIFQKKWETENYRSYLLADNGWMDLQCIAMDNYKLDYD